MKEDNNMRFSIKAILTGGSIATMLLLSASARAADFHVPGDFGTIQSAVLNAAEGSTIIVGPGAYHETISWSGKRLTIRGAGAGLCTIDMSGSGRAFTLEDLPSDSRLEGFTFKNGYEFMGGAIECLSSNLTIADCEFVENYAEFAGGGVHVAGGSPAITNCKFVGNSTVFNGGGICIENSAASITGCEFDGNHAEMQGGAIFNSGGAPTISATLAHDNWAEFAGGAVFNMDSSATLFGCTLRDNTAPSGGGVTNAGGKASILNSVFTENKGSFVGGGMANDGGEPLVLSCVFVGNEAAQAGGGIVNRYGAAALILNSTFTGNSVTGIGGAVASTQGGKPHILSSILWGNGLREVWADSSSAMQIDYSDVKGGAQGTANLDIDPLFINPAGGDLRLQPGSSCIDKGFLHSAITSSSVDLAGQPRVIGASVDMGAYEAPKPQVDVAGLIRQLRADVTDLVSGGAKLPANGQSLYAKLDAALAALRAGDNAGAVAKLQDFLNQVRALVKTGRLSPSQGEMLSSNARSAIEQLGS
jgi:hypothetical protein